MSPQAREHSFDELARGLASGSISRGRALRLMGAALVGGTLGSLGIRGATADQGDQGENEECKAAGRSVGRTTSAVAETAKAAPARLRAYRIANPAPRTASAVAACASSSMASPPAFATVYWGDVSQRSVLT